MFSRLAPRLIRNIQSRNITSSLKLCNNKIYNDKEEWIKHTLESTELGISKNAHEQLGEIVYIEFPFDKGDIVDKGDDIVIIESVKATEGIQAPFDCVLLGNNLNLEDNLDLLNEEPEETWLVKIDKIP